jgi:hypothetical protein
MGTTDLTLDKRLRLGVTALHSQSTRTLKKPALYMDWPNKIQIMLNLILAISLARMVPQNIFQALTTGSITIAMEILI